MKSAIESSMLWRTTYVLGTLSFASIFAYVGIAAATDPEHSAVFRMVAASSLIIAACACVVAAFRGRRENGS